MGLHSVVSGLGASVKGEMNYIPRRVGQAFSFYNILTYQLRIVHRYMYMHISRNVFRKLDALVTLVFLGFFLPSLHFKIINSLYK